jgi:hypothetical protein
LRCSTQLAIRHFWSTTQIDSGKGYFQQESPGPHRGRPPELQYNSCGMAAGDAQRVWFREMIERLRSQWHPGMSFDGLVELRDELDAMLERIRAERHIRSTVFQCPKCGHVGEGRQPHVSVRAMILSLGRFGFAAAEQTRALEKAWAAHRTQKGLDLYGVVSPVGEAGGCVHPQTR